MRHHWLSIGLATTVVMASRLLAQTWVDISPKKSTLHGSQPNGASGGRVNGLAASSDKSAFYAATEWGGLFKSTDNGATWTHLPKHSALATWHVAVDPSNPSLVYATSFYDGKVNSQSGINWSNNAGATWTHAVVADPLALCPDITKQEPSAFGIAIDRSTGAVFVGTDCGVAKSTDQGRTWTYVYPKIKADTGRVWSVVVHDGGVVDICGDQGHVRSPDGGVTWVDDANHPLPSGRCSLAVSPFDSNTLFAVSGTTLHESTNGSSWRYFTGGDDGTRSPLVMTNKRSGGSNYELWFGQARIYRADCQTPEQTGPQKQCIHSLGADLGFQMGAHEDAGGLLFDPASAVDACPLLYANDGGIDVNTNVARATCRNVSWSQADANPHALWIRWLAGAMNPDASTALYFGTQDNGLFATMNAEKLPAPEWTNVDPSDVMDVATDGSRVVSTLCCFDGKRLFVRQPGATGLNLAPDTTRQPLDGDGVVAVTRQKVYGLLTTKGLYLNSAITSAPNTWTRVGWPVVAGHSKGWSLGQLSASGTTSGGAVFFARLTDIDSIRQSSVWRYDVRGDTWSRITPPGGQGGFGVFTADRDDPNRLFASHTVLGSDPEMVLSTDGGATWTKLTALDACMKGSGKFRYGTVVGPTGWGSLFEGYDQPTVVAFAPGDPTLLVAGAADAGLFLSFDRGTKWVRVTNPHDPATNGIPNLPRPRAVYFPERTPINLMFVATQGRGLWRLSIDATVRGLLPNC